MREIWSDAQLDAALAELRTGQPRDERALAATRAKLLATASATNGGKVVTITEETRPPATPQRHRRSGPWLAAAAAVVAVAVGVSLIRSLQPDDGATPAAATATAVLERAAAAAGAASDPAVNPGQFRYIDRHEWHLAAGTGRKGQNYAFVREERIELWVPSNGFQFWLLRQSFTGKYEWLAGNEQEIRAEGAGPRPASSEDLRALCGNFYRDPAGNRCTGPGSWDDPTPTFLAELPRDPQQLLERLRGRITGPTQSRPPPITPERTQAPPTTGPSDDSLALRNAAVLLGSGQAPAEVRQALYQALRGIPRLAVIGQVTNVDGRQGTALAIDGPGDGIREEIIIVPETGEFIGSRHVTTRDWPDGIKAGTTISHTAVSTRVADQIGVRPGG